MTRGQLRDVKRPVIKVGSSLLEEDSDSMVAGLTRQIQRLVEEGREPVLVSSGAILFGMEAMGLDTYPVTLPRKQAAAAVGQSRLMEHYRRYFAECGLETAQVLLTQEGIHNRQTYLNASNTLNTLLEMNVVPIVNENDTVATEEIQFGDNDTLSALVATLVDADLLVILSDVDGLYRGDPDEEEGPVSRVEAMTDEVHGWVRRESDSEGRATVGGMATKLEAAETVTRSGTPMVIASGHVEDVLGAILSGEEVGTLFEPARGEDIVQGRKRWIGYHLPSKGTIRVDEGAARALLERGKSLLPSGVVHVEGRFQRGDAVRVENPSERELGRGLVNYSLQEVQRLQGCQTDEISDILGYHNFDEIIHRDNLVVFQDGRHTR